MIRPLVNIGRRYLLRHPWQTVLMVLGITLGVAVMVAIDLANSAASRAFDLSTETVAGRATHQIIGGPQGVDEGLYTQLRLGGLDMPAAPVVTGYVTAPQLGSRPIQLLGVDPFAEAPFRSYLVPSEPSSGAEPSSASGVASAADPVDVGQLVAFLTQPGALLLSQQMADDYGLLIGDLVDLNAGGRKTSGSVVGLIQSGDRLTRRALDGLILTDIASAQEIFGRAGFLDHVDLILPAGETGESLSARLPNDVRIVPVSARAGALAQMTAAFRTNLTALSLLALVVGMFLIYNSMTFSVVQRRPLFGTLRCLGVTRREIGAMILIEAVIAGALGSILGIGLGVLLGQGAVKLVTQTINDLYFVVTVRGIAVPAGSLAKGGLLGVLATVASAALPAWEATQVPPRLALFRSGLEDKARRTVPQTAMAGALGLLLGGGLLAVPAPAGESGPGLGLVISFTGIFLITVGFALLSPAFTLLFLRGVTPFTQRVFGVLGRMAPRGISAALSRTAVAIAALMVAVSVTIGVGLMVDSFRKTVQVWLAQTLWSDIYISAPSQTAARSSAPLDGRILDIVHDWPGVAGAEVLRAVDVSSPVGPIAVAAVSDEDFTAPRIFVDQKDARSGGRSGGREQFAVAVKNGAVLISEPLANRLGLSSPGAGITLFTDRGEQTFPVAGIYRDYASSQGTVMMALDLYRSHWDDPAITAIALQLADGVNADNIVKSLEPRLNGIQGVLIRPNRALRAEAMAVFDRAFAITGALQMLAALVAFIGVLSALLSLQLDRTRELGVLRAVGMTARQLRGAVLLETGIMGAAAGLLAMPTGIALALILIYIINRRSFGWTLQLQVTPGVFLQALALAVIAAVLAGVYPALRMSRMLAADALRGE